MNHRSLLSRHGEKYHIYQLMQLFGHSDEFAMHALNEIHPSYTLFPLYQRKSAISLLCWTDLGLHSYVSRVS